MNDLQISDLEDSLSYPKLRLPFLGTNISLTGSPVEPSTVPPLCCEVNTHY